MCHGVQQSERACLKINSFYVRLSVCGNRKLIPDSLTLCYLPRINGSPLEINGSWILPDSTGFLTLHRVVSGGWLALFGSRERVRLSEGARFQVFLGENKVLSGTFRKDEGNEWKMDVKCVLESEIEVREAEVHVAAEGEATMQEKVAVVSRRKNKYCFQKLEEIPEQREGDVAELDGFCCCSGWNGEDFDVRTDSRDFCDGEGVDLTGVRRAVDVGIWVVCFGLGVGYLISKAASKRIHPKINLR